MLYVICLSLQIRKPFELQMVDCNLNCCYFSSLSFNLGQTHILITFISNYSGCMSRKFKLVAVRSLYMPKRALVRFLSIVIEPGSINVTMTISFGEGKPL